MSAGSGPVAPATGLPTVRGILGALRRPPLRDRHFWVIQALILVIVAGHLVLDLRGQRLWGGIPDYPTVGLFLLPIIYAALRFGLVGACASAAWGTVLMVPDLVVVDSSFDLWGDGTLLAIGCIVAVAVGQRVEREAAARRAAQAALVAHQAAEARFRALFDAGSVPALVVDGAGRLREANPAALGLFGQRLEQGGLDQVLGAGTTRRLLSGEVPSQLELRSAAGGVLLVRPLVTRLTDEAGNPLHQIALQDVTAEAERQRLTAAYAAQALQLREEDRQRIARDIHDQPLQTLIYLARRLEASAQAPDVPRSSREELEALRSGIVAVVAELRQLADGLRPPALDDLGLVASLRQLGQDFSERTGVKVELRSRGREPARGWEGRTDVYRIVQEALRNVERHARAGRVSVWTVFTATRVRVRVADDGQGFRAQPLTGGMGITGMRERALLAGGQVEIVSAAGRGTVVRVTVPIQAKAAPDPVGEVGCPAAAVGDLVQPITGGPSPGLAASAGA